MRRASGSAKTACSSLTESGNNVQILERKGEIFSKRAVVCDDPEHGSPRTVRFSPRRQKIADGAITVR